MNSITRLFKLYGIILMVSFFGFTACITNSKTLTPSKNIPNDWMELELGNELYFAKTSKVDYIKKCLNDFTLDEICGNLIPTREQRKHINPLQELLRVNGTCALDFKLAIDPMGEVLMVGIENYTANVSYQLAKKSAINLLSTEYMKDTNLDCMECQPYKIILSRE